MTLYLLRHGLAEPAHSGRGDQSRNLTSEGLRRIEYQAKAFVRMGIRVDQLLCSPYPRARQTADMVGSALGIEPVQDRRLAPGCTVEQVLDVLREHGDPAAAMVVGHQPDLAYITQALTGSVVAVREGTLIAIEARVPRLHQGALAGLYDPDRMVALGQSFQASGG